MAVNFGWQSLTFFKEYGRDIGSESYYRKFRYLISDQKCLLHLTHIGKSRKQNPKIGCVTERHLRKQNPIQFYERINHSD